MRVHVVHDSPDTLPLANGVQLASAGRLPPARGYTGASVESDKYRGRIEHLRHTGARIKFLSLEPLLGPLSNLNLRSIDWVIAGGESGPASRPMDPAWARDIRDQCRRARVPFFFKQWGGKNKKRAGRVLDGRTWNEVPGGSEPRAVTRA